MDMQLRRPPALFTNATSNVTSIDQSEMEAKFRQQVVESRGRRMKSGEINPVLNSHVGYLEPSTPASATHCSSYDATLSSGTPSLAQQDAMITLAAEQRRLAEEIALAKNQLARLESLKPKSAQRMRKWPETNMAAMILYISDDEEDDSIPQGS